MPGSGTVDVISAGKVPSEHQRNRNASARVGTDLAKGHLCQSEREQDGEKQAPRLRSAAQDGREEEISLEVEGVEFSASSHDGDSWG